MPSNARQGFLEPVLQDAGDLFSGHAKLATGLRGRQWGLGGLNRSTVVMCAAAWESYIEEVVREAAEALKPANPPLGTWPALIASVRGSTGRLHTPNSQNVRRLIADAFGLVDVTASWYWKNCSATTATQYLDDFLNLRHEIAHGVTPRPIVHNKNARWYPWFVRRLAQRTDQALVDYFAGSLEHRTG